jgi:hypothetical protein
MPIKPTKPIFEDSEGRFKLAIFKNKNVNGKVYPLVCVTALKFPFKFSTKIYLNPTEIGKLIKLLERVPKIERKENKE